MPASVSNSFSLNPIAKAGPPLAKLGSDFELRDRFKQIDLPLQMGPATIEEAQAEFETLLDLHGFRTGYPFAHAPKISFPRQPLEHIPHVRIPHFELVRAVA